MKSILPKYQQLVQELRQGIVCEVYPPGGQLPTEEKLAKQFGFSRETVRKALSQLEGEGLIRREQGVGSFVHEPHPGAIPFHFLEKDSHSGKKVSYRVLRQDVEPATLEYAERLKVGQGERVIHIAQVKLIGGAPVSYAERHLPYALCLKLAKEDLTRRAAHEVLSEHVKLPPTRTVIEIEGRALSEAEARWLECPTDTPGIIVNRMSYTAPNQPAVMYRGIFRDRYLMEIELELSPASQSGNHE